MRINRECFFGSNLPKNGFWGRNFKNLTGDLESALAKYHACQFSGKIDNFDIFDPSLPKNKFRGQNFENQLFQDSVCVNFQPKWIALALLTQIYPKMHFEVEIWKCKFKFWISSSKIPCVPFSKQNSFNFFGLNMHKNGFWGHNFENPCPDLESAPQRYGQNG